ncbi:uncharacterized protein LOC118764608 isoform X3 [Octopus sinensis]|uniref:Uncharacterized protein LOC118764608 isoform X3 n=1 Tax=Octopus sinensis TaxID=2607531 RepID=A0A7E6F1L2_9MOLL|nr:uncharacterized protein LOC118764608 isoform X3 [Octopus sinensis]
MLGLLNQSIWCESGCIALSSIINCCISTYGIINDSFKNNTYIFIYITLLTCAGFLNLMFMFWLGIRLNKSVHSITQSIHYMQFQGVDQEVVAKILVFLNRLTTESHGIDVGGCFVITPSSTLTMIGSFITYILVVIQTKPL